MGLTKKVFWNDALRGGTIIGLVSISFSLLGWAIGRLDVSFWGGLLSLVSIAVFVALVYGFTRKLSMKASAAEGFSYGKGVSFVLAMMLFTGVIKGVYTAIMNNFVDPEAVVKLIDEMMLILQDWITGDEFDQLYAIYHRIMYNPLYLVFGAVLNSVIGGLIVSLITSAMTKREPNIFADQETEA